jgi:hypothetical protein
MQTLAERLKECDFKPSGFDYLRISLATIVIVAHTVNVVEKSIHDRRKVWLRIEAWVLAALNRSPKAAPATAPWWGSPLAG